MRGMFWTGGLSMMLALQGCAASSQTADNIGIYNLSAQRLSGAENVVVNGTSGFASLTVLVTVGVDGKVVSAKATDNSDKVDPRPGLAAAEQWTFRPQTVDGHPVQAVGTISIAYRPPEKAPDRSVPFPTAPPNNVEIKLERSACFGTCPDYGVIIRGDGSIRFFDRNPNDPPSDADVHLGFMGRNILWSGIHETTVDPAAVTALVDRFRAAHFMGMQSSYEASVTDNPTYRLTLKVGSTTKEGTDYVGAAVGMPASITALEDAVDRVAETDRWVRGNAGTIALLKAEGFDFRSKQAAEMVQAAMLLNSWPRGGIGAEPFIMGALAEGLDLTLPVPHPASDREKAMVSIGSLITRYAAENGRDMLFEEMVRRGQLAKMEHTQLDGALAGGAGCNVKIARALVAAGANPAARNDQGNALHALRDHYGPCQDSGSAAMLEAAQALIALGVPLEARDDLGWTVIMGVNDPALANLLLKAGADPNARDEKDGTTPVLSVDDDRVILTLLQAGADPNVKDYQGTLRQQAVKRNWPATLRWLDAHGVKK